MGTSCGQGVTKEHRMMRFFLSVVLAGAALADSEPYTIGQVAHGYGQGIITGVDYGHGLVSGYGAIGNRGYYGGYAGYGSIHHGFYENVKPTVTLMHTPLAKLPTDSLWPTPTLLAILTILESSLESVTPDTEVMLDMEVTIMDSMASVRLTLMPTPLARLPTDSLWPMLTLLAILTMLELSPELVIPATEVMLDTEVTLDTSSDKCLPGHCPATYLLNDFTCFLKNKNYKTE